MASESSSSKYKTLPPPVKLEDTVLTVDPEPVLDPELGHNTETEFMFRYVG